MNCIDAVEGTVKSIINGLFQLFIESGFDDTEYIRSIKKVLDSTDTFLRNNKEIAGNPNTFKDVLYRYAKDLWLKQLVNKTKSSDDVKEQIVEKMEYYEYYFDYIYGHGTYPR
ncbi:MAG: hypothetical protein KKC46_07405 [Proteobacteria bacterium]|nr:hypothetical protein [Pseudomonadota bacterium]